MNTAYLLTGGNMGDRVINLQNVRQYIEAACGDIVHASDLYETAPWGKTDQSLFLNQALELHTSFSASELMTSLLSIEKKMGRKRLEKNGPRIIDIDILLFNHEIITSSLVTVPHPELPNRRFALQPLADIAPDYEHPILKKTIVQLLAICPDKLGVNKFRVK